MHRFAHDFVAAERERDIAHAAGDFHSGANLLDFSRGFEKVDRVAIVFFDARGDGENVGVEDDVGRRHADFFGEQAIGPLADAHPVVDARGLALLVEGHDDHAGVLQRRRAGLACTSSSSPALRLIERDISLALHAFSSSGLDHRPFRAIDHDRHTAISSAAIRSRTRSPAASPSSRASSMFTSITLAPDSTC